MLCARCAVEHRQHVGTNDGRVCLHVSIEMVLANKHAKTTTITMVVTFFSLFPLFFAYAVSSLTHSVACSQLGVLTNVHRRTSATV